MYNLHTSYSGIPCSTILPEINRISIAHVNVPRRIGMDLEYPSVKEGFFVDIAIHGFDSLFYLILFL